MKKNSILLLLSVFILLLNSCKKSNVAGSNDCLVVVDAQGTRDSFPMDGSQLTVEASFSGNFCSNGQTGKSGGKFSAIAGVSYSIDFGVYSSIDCSTGIVPGTTYTTIGSGNFYKEDIQFGNPIFLATKTEVTFSEYNYPGKIAGTFKAYQNNVVAYSGYFTFTQR